jgi:elongation factor Ts
MANITLEDIKKLRERTGVGINHVKMALEKSDGDIEKAIVYLREQGIAKAARRAGNATDHGIIGSYIHGTGMAVLVEVQSETDFAAGSTEFLQFAKELAMHIASQSPEYISIESIPAEIVETEKKIYAKDVEGKPANVAEKILEGKLVKFYEEKVLMEQTFIKDEQKKIKDLLNEKVAALGESLIIKRFVRMELGEEPIVASI